MIVKFKFLIFPLLAAFILLGCDPGVPGQGSAGVQGSGFAAALTQQEFNALTPEQQYAVANKLYGTMFRGLSVEDFFDTSNGITTLSPKSSNFLAETKAKLETKLPQSEVDKDNTIIDGIDSQGNPVAANAKYIFDDYRPLEIPLARIKEYPVSNQLFVNWIAYFLTNTIMFSPAIEMDAPDQTDAQNMYRFLVTNIAANTGVRNIVKSNLSSLERWRVSRSAENQALEGLELYLGLFNDQTDTYNGGIACKDFYLTNANQGYMLARTDFPNTIPQLIMGQYYVTTCSDLSSVIAGSPLLMPRVVEVIVDYLMAGRSQADRISMTQAIVNSGATTFQDIFKEILFSKEYLLDTERSKSYEENLMPMLDRLKWDPAASYPVNKYIFEYMASKNDHTSSSNHMNMADMGWSTMIYKIGRPNGVPLDSQSFASYHKSMREDLLMKTYSYSGQKTGVPGLLYDGNGNVRPFISNLSLHDYIDFLFLTALNRKATTTEQTALTQVFDNDGYLKHNTDGTITIPDYRYDDIASVTFDYISRLPEFYYFQAIN